MATRAKKRTTAHPDLKIELGMPLKWAKKHNLCEFWADFTQPASITLGNRTVIICTQDSVYADVYDKKGKEIGNISSGAEFDALFKNDTALLDAMDSGRLDVIEVSSFFIASDNARDSRLLDDEEGNHFLTLTESLCAALAFLEKGSLDENPSVDELHILDYVVTP
jgi:hypothetical protein